MVDIELLFRFVSSMRSDVAWGDDFWPEPVEKDGDAMPSVNAMKASSLISENQNERRPPRTGYT